MRIAALLRRIREKGSESGQVLVLFALGLVGFIALVGLAVDVGQIVQTRTDLQKAADAAVFAAAQDLPNAGTAEATAQHYVTENAGENAQAIVTFDNSSGHAVTVEVERPVNYTFLRVLGMSGTDVSARATARVGSFSGGSGLVPWGLIASDDDGSTLLQNDCYIGVDANGNALFEHNTQCTLMYGAGVKPDGQGDFGAIALDGTGADTYRHNIANGSNAVFSRGDKVHPQTGNMVGPTQQGVQDRLNRPPPPGCDGNSRSDVLRNNGDGSVSIRPGCEHSPRIVLIPVVDRIDNPNQSEILGFAFMFLTGIHGGGGHMEVRGEFVEFVTELPGAEYFDTGSGAKAIKLVE